MKTLSEIQTILMQYAGELREHYGITNLAIFGSIVRGEMTKKEMLTYWLVFYRR